MKKIIYFIKSNKIYFIIVLIVAIFSIGIYIMVNQEKYNKIKSEIGTGKTLFSSENNGEKKITPDIFFVNTTTNKVTFKDSKEALNYLKNQNIFVGKDIENAEEFIRNYLTDCCKNDIAVDINYYYPKIRDEMLAKSKIEFYDKDNRFTFDIKDVNIKSEKDKWNIAYGLDNKVYNVSYKLEMSYRDSLYSTVNVTGEYCIVKWKNQFYLFDFNHKIQKIK